MMRPYIFGADGATHALKTRIVRGGTLHEVVDLIRPGQLALVVCVRCGAIWNEGGDIDPPWCKP